MEKENHFLAIIKKNELRIQKLCAMYASNKEDQKDLEQEVVLNIWKSISNFRGESNIDTWVYRIILNICFKHHYRKNRNTVSLDNLNFEPSERQDNQPEIYLDLKKCIQALEFSDKTIMILFLEELPYKTISEIVGISENYVAVKIKRIKILLRKCLTSKNKSS